MLKQSLTPKQVALAIGVSEASLKRWCDKGLLPFTRTAGGHRRLQVSGVVQFLRASGQQLVRPEILGLPSMVGQGDATLGRTRERLRTAMEAGDEEQVMRIIFGMYLAGHSAWDICDKLMAPCFREIGHGWENGQVQVYQERRSCEICMRVLFRIRGSIPKPEAGAPAAIGGTLEDDPYMLPTAMVAVALREAGWQAESYGAGHPANTLCAALRDARPRLFWLSVSAMGSAERFIADYRTIYETATELGVAVVIGGRALTETIRHEIRYSAYCDNLAHLIGFVKTLNGPPRE